MRENDVTKPFAAQIRDAVIIEGGPYDGGTIWQMLGWLPNKPKAYYAFEPDPRRLRVLSGIKFPPPVQIIPAALGGADGKGMLHLSESVIHPMWEMSSTLLEPDAGMVEWMRFPKSVEVPVRSVDSWCREKGLDHIDFLWADIEGAERAMVMEGMVGMLDHTHYMFLEIWPSRQHKGAWTYEEMCADLQPRGWRVVERFTYDVLVENMGYKA